LPTVSIIVPNYNHAPFLAQRLDSIFNQTYQDFEVVLLDDASSDNSVEILNLYAEKYKEKISHFIVNQNNSGSPFKQWKKGIELAKGEYIWIAESDDWAEPELLQTLLNYLTKHKNVGLAYCQSFEVDVHSNRIRDFHFWTDDLDPTLWRKNFVLPGSTFLNYLVKKNVIPNASAVLFRKALYKDVGKVQTNFRLVGDWDLWVRLLAKASIGYSPLCLNHFRASSSTTRYIVRKDKKELRILEELKMLKGLAHLNCVEGELINIQQQYLLNEWKKLYISDFQPVLIFKNFDFFKFNLFYNYRWKEVMKLSKAIFSYLKLKSYKAE